jgi:hypothetical protein
MLILTGLRESISAADHFLSGLACLCFSTLQHLSVNASILAKWVSFKGCLEAMNALLLVISYVKIHSLLRTSIGLVLIHPF